MKTKLILTILTTCALTSCKKDYVCECSNQNGVFARQTFHETKKRAKELCPGGMTMLALYQPDAHCELK